MRNIIALINILFLVLFLSETTLGDDINVTVRGSNNKINIGQEISKKESELYNIITIAEIRNGEVKVIGTYEVPKTVILGDELIIKERKNMEDLYVLNKAEKKDELYICKLTDKKITFTLIDFWYESINMGITNKYNVIFVDSVNENSYDITIQDSREIEKENTELIKKIWEEKDTYYKSVMNKKIVIVVSEFILILLYTLVYKLYRMIDEKDKNIKRDFKESAIKLSLLNLLNLILMLCIASNFKIELLITILIIKIVVFVMCFII